MASQKFPHTFPMVGIACTDKFAQLLLYISYEQSDLYMLVTTKSLLVPTSCKGLGEHKQSIASHMSVASKLAMYFSILEKIAKPC